MSRMLNWVQDEEEIDYVLSEKGIEESSRGLTQEYERLKDSSNVIENRKKDIVSCMSSRKYLLSNVSITRDEFLTLFDTCYNFLSEINDEEVQRIVNITIQLAKEPMKSSVWKPRAKHHVFLLIDGLVKHRCLFKDYDSTFTAKQEDYDLAERILLRMVKGWDTNLAPKERFQ